MVTARSSVESSPAPVAFQDGADFISFDFGDDGHQSDASSSSSSSDQGTSTSTSAKGKGKAGPRGKKRSVDDREADQGEYRNRKDERRAASRTVPWADDVDWSSCRTPADMLNREISAFYKFMSPMPHEHAVRGYIISLITRAVKNQWADAEVLPFGSWQTQLYLPRGDIDLVVRSSQIERQPKTQVLYALAAALRRANLAENVQIIGRAKVPIVKFVSSFGRFNVDISINQINGVSAGQIVNSYIDCLPALRPLVLVIKAFLSQRSMNEVYSGGLGSYSVICMVISFLQLHPKLRRKEIEPLSNLGVLLVEFFELYGRNFSYTDTGISIRRGGSYFSKKARGWTHAQQAFLLSVEDPQDEDNDISRSSHGIIRVKQTLAGAYELLTSQLFLRAEHIALQRMGGRRADDDPESMSILSSVMGCPPETTSHRKLIKSLYEAGTLQGMLGIPVEPIASLKKVKMPTAAAPSEKKTVQDNGNSRHSRFPSDPPTDTTTTKSKKKKEKATAPPPPPARSGVTAIHVDDDEASDAASVWSVSSGETSSAKPRAPTANSHKPTKAERKKAKDAARKAKKRAEKAAFAAAQRPADEEDDEMEDGEVVEDSIGSLDSLEEQGFKELAEQAGIEREESDSRYALASGPKRKRTKPNPPAKPAKTYVESDSGSSDSSILPLPTPSSRKASSNASPAPSDMAKKQIKAARRIEEQAKAKIAAIARKSRENSATLSRTGRSGTVDSFHEDDDVGTPLARGAPSPMKIKGAAKKAREAVDSKRKFWAAKADMGGVAEEEHDDFQDGSDFISL